MKKRILALAVFVAVMLASCHKTCTCYGYDYVEYDFTPDEVDSLASSCESMVYRAGMQYYSYCFWQ